jgi:hypothetical protein
MGLFTKENTTTVVRQSYADKLGNIKSMFQVAHSKALAFHEEMQKEIDAEKAQVASINEQIKEISATQAETNKFMSNLEKFI